MSPQAPWLPPPWQAPRPLPGRVTTSRTVVRLYEPGDGAAHFDAVEADRGALLPWMAWARASHRSRDESEAYVASAVRGYEEKHCLDFPMGIFDRVTGELLGGTGLHDLQPALGQAEVGYWVRGDRQGEGLCTEAVRALLRWALAKQREGGWGLRRLVVYHAVENVASRKVCERLGLRQEALLRRARYLGPPGEGPGWYDVVGYGILADEAPSAG